MTGKKKTVLYIVSALVVALAGLWLLQRLLEPKYMHGIVEGAMIAEYYNEDMDHDVVLSGIASCMKISVPPSCGRITASTATSGAARSS